jgi:hypothetical protein
MKRLTYLLLIGVVGLYFGGCEKQPANPTEDGLKVDPAIEKLTPFGWNANRMVSSSNEIKQVTNISQYLETEGANGLPGIGSLKKQAIGLSKSAKIECNSFKGLMKVLSDSLLFFEDDSVKGIRKALYYDAETGVARYYEVKYKFAAWQQLIYDSSEIKVDLKHTPGDSLDDVLLGFYQLQRFNEKFFVQKIINDVRVTHTSGIQISGIEATRDALYQSDRYLIHLRQLVDINPDKSGTLREDFEFKDGKTAFRSVTFYPDNTGEFARQLRDGTIVTGKFNSVEDDGEGYYQELTVFPDGRYIDKIEKSASVTLTLPDSIYHINLKETITYRSGRAVTDTAAIVTQTQYGVTNTTIQYSKHNGEHGTFCMVENEGGSTVDGNWTTIEGYYILLSAEYYLDQSGHVHFEVYESEAAYNNGDDPIIVADYYFSPDGSGTGTLSYNGQSYDISFSDSGDAEIFADGKSAKINLFQ